MQGGLEFPPAVRPAGHPQIQLVTMGAVEGQQIIDESSRRKAAHVGRQRGIGQVGSPAP